jgi:hypothetical protein
MDMATVLKRTQMYFPEDMLQQIRQLADSENTTIADIVRNAVGEFLKKKKREIDWDNDPLWDIVNQAEGSGRHDVSVNHDAYLYGGKQ